MSVFRPATVSVDAFLSSLIHARCYRFPVWFVALLSSEICGNVLETLQLESQFRVRELRQLSLFLHVRSAPLDGLSVCVRALLRVKTELKRKQII